MKIMILQPSFEWICFILSSVLEGKGETINSTFSVFLHSRKHGVLLHRLTFKSDSLEKGSAHTLKNNSLLVINKIPT